MDLEALDDKYRDILGKIYAQEPDKYGVRCSRWALVYDSDEQRQADLDMLFAAGLPLRWNGQFFHKLQRPAADDTVVDADLILLVDTRPVLEPRPNSKDRCRDHMTLLCIEVTGGWADPRCSDGIRDALRVRVGRYPSRQRGGPTWSGILEYA